MNKPKKAVRRLLSKFVIVLISITAMVINCGYCPLFFSADSETMSYRGDVMIFFGTVFGIFTSCSMLLAFEQFERMAGTINVLPVKKEAVVKQFIDRSGKIYLVQNLALIICSLSVWFLGEINAFQLAVVLVDLILFFLISSMTFCVYILCCKTGLNRAIFASEFCVVMAIEFSVKARLDAMIIIAPDIKLFLSVISILTVLAAILFVLIRNKTARVLY